MKKWALIVAVLYGLLLMALAVPLCWLALGGKAKWSDLSEIWTSGISWVVIAILILAQWALLRIPVDFTSRRPEGKRPVIFTVVAAAFAMGLLAFGLAACAIELATKLEFKGYWPLITMLGVLAAAWIYWGARFFKMTRSQTPDAPLTGLREVLRKGSIMELLIAIPCHIWARQRNDCCGGMFTVIGLACGIAVMLFAFGPAVYFLFVERMKRLRPAA